MPLNPSLLKMRSELACQEDKVGFDLNQTDKLLSTTRAVRKRLDFDRPVPGGVTEECIGLSQKAATRGCAPH